jgi:malonyl-CoA O-methyltransferase
MLVAAGFADPVMDQETITLTWSDAKAALAELRSLGGNVDCARHAGLRTPRWRQRLEAAIAQLAAADGRPALRFEIVYGHAFKPLPRPRVQGETRLSVDELRTMARAGRPRAG